MDRIPTYIDTTTQQISEIAVGDGLDITGGGVKADAVEADGVKAGTFTETVVPVDYSGTNATADLSKANNFSMDFSSGDTYTFALTGAPSDAGDAYGCTIILDTTGMAALTWSNVQWAGGVAPTLVADTVNVITIITTDGTSFKGFVGGQAFA
jgi:hypothetical protein